MGRAYFNLRRYPEAWQQMKCAIRDELYPNVRGKALLTLGEGIIRSHLLSTRI
jgi:hypothetical protein